jgi:DeoR family transcriptional regulator, suf operon transcriptional repressor
MVALEQLGYTEQASQRQTGGRPAILYKMSLKGFELFPKQYAWFSEIMLQTLRESGGPGVLEKWMREMGRSVARGLLPSLKGTSERERLEAVVSVMNQLAYEAKVVEGSGEIDATNCVYHALAARFPEVCEFDRELLRVLMEGSVDHKTCMVKGGGSCRFGFKKTT